MSTTPTVQKILSHYESDNAGVKTEQTASGAKAELTRGIAPPTPAQHSPNLNEAADSNGRSSYLLMQPIYKRAYVEGVVPKHKVPQTVTSFLCVSFILSYFPLHHLCCRMASGRSIHACRSARRLGTMPCKP